jgi:hypothetical protein
VCGVFQDAPPPPPAPSGPAPLGVGTPAPYDEADAGRGRAAERHGRVRISPAAAPAANKPRRCITFGGGKGSRIGSGLSLPRIALRERMRGENGNLSLSMMS